MGPSPLLSSDQKRPGEEDTGGRAHTQWLPYWSFREQRGTGEGRSQVGGKGALKNEKPRLSGRAAAVRPAQEGHRVLQTAQGLTPKRFRRIKKLLLSNPSNSTPWHTIRLSRI